MMINVLLPQVEVDPDSNFTRKLQVFSVGSEVLDLDWDESEKELMLEVDDVGELRIQVTQQGDSKPMSAVVEADLFHDYSCAYFTTWKEGIEKEYEVEDEEVDLPDHWRTNNCLVLFLHKY